MQTLNIIGAGRVGKSLARLFFDKQIFEIAQVYTQSAKTNLTALEFISSGIGITDIKQVQVADITLLAVPDDHLVDTTKALLECGALPVGGLLFHCSGSKSSLDLLAQVPALDQLQIQLASVHPVRSFADVAAVVEDFSGTICSIEGSARALAILESAFVGIGAQLIPVKPEAKMLYHAASVFASNYLVTLMDIAIDAYCAAGIPMESAHKMARALSAKSLENVFNLGTMSALTGPIKRGDMKTVAYQQEVVTAWDEQRGAVYQAFIAPTIALAQKTRD
ncbi:Rossmann-like and DUF2520 domain-containing protein [Undibacterium sp. Di24W]|uniref:Rossmann-like and DUF2520 domain-containing protein n=1 Tax=Undibacterium sp. Di24W TaxID=3413033 RepID=UPI003BEFAF17